MKTTIFIALLLAFNGAFGQKTKIDSLQNILQHSREDTGKVNLLNKLSAQIADSSVVLADDYATQALLLAQKLHWQKGEGFANIRKAAIAKEQNKYQEALAIYQQALHLFTQANYRKGQIDAYNGIGYVYIGLSDYHQAMTHFSNALKISEELNDNQNIAYTLNNINRVCYYLSDHTKSLEYLTRTEKIMQRLHDNSGLAFVYIGMGITYYELASYPRSLEYYLKALKLYEETGYKNGIASSMENIGLVYNVLADYPRALNYLLKAQQIFETIHGKEQITHLLGNIGAVYLSLNKPTEALACFSKDLQLSEESGSKRISAYSLNGIGSVYTYKHEYAKALEQYEKALKIFKETNDKSGIANALRNMGQAHLNNHQYGEAIKELTDALAIFKEIKATGDESSTELLRSNCYEKLGNPQLALKAYKQSVTLLDSVVNAEKGKEITRKQMQYDFDKKEATQKAEQEKKDAIAHTESLKQKMILNSFIAGFLMVGILAGLIYRNYRQKKAINNELEKKNLLVETQKKEITDSINYAKRIQTAILPDIHDMGKYFTEAFVLFKPKDIVSGDFYTFSSQDNTVILAAVDCTGHGVPGAFMSVIGHNLLMEIIVERGITTPSEILEHLNRDVRKALKQDKNDTRDGMDVVLCSINTTTLQLQYAGANRPLWIVNSHGGFEEIKADKQAIGGAHTEHHKPFTNHTLQLHKKDTFYLFSDGFADQFGGPDGKKLMSRRFKETILTIQNRNMHEQEMALNKEFEAWKGNLEQIDDVLVIGIRL